MTIHQKWLLILLSATIAINSVNAIQCDLSDNCLCYQPTPTTYEFHCPPESPKTITRTNLNYVEIECLVDLNWQNATLPKINLQHADLIKITMCPLPQQGLNEIFDKIGVSGADGLMYTFTRSENASFVLNETNVLKHIKTLDISHNDIESLKGDEFIQVSQIERLDLSHNLITNLPVSIFNALQGLRVLNLSDNVIKEFPKGIFVKNGAMEVLDLSGNLVDLTTLIDEVPSVKKLRMRNAEITNIPDRFFINLTHLEDLDLSGNKITAFSEFVFQPLIRLKSLNIENNFMTQITKKAFHHNVRLEKINFSGNLISYIHIHAFQRNVDLKEIRLANNKYRLTQNEINLGVSPFQANLNLEYLDLSRNRITEISDDWIISKIHLKTLDLSYNEIRTLMLTDLMGVSSDLTIDLRHNKITTIDFRMSKHLKSDDHLQQRFVYLDYNPLQCDCHIYDFTRYFDGTINPIIPLAIKIKSDNLYCSGPDEYTNKLITEIQSKTLSCPVKNCPEKCECKYRAWDRAMVIDCANKNLTQVPLLSHTNGFYNYTEVDLHGNLLRNGPIEKMGYENVDVLNLSHNNISEIAWIPPKLQVLNLTYNRLENLDENVLHMLNASIFLKSLWLGENPWKCGCSALNLRSFLITYLIGKRMIDADNIKCTTDARLVIHLSINDVCLTLSSLIVICSLVFAFIASAISILTCACAFSRRKRLYTAF